LKLKTILLIGDIDRPEFREAAAAMRARCRVVCAANLAEARDLVVRETCLPELVAIAQVRPSEYQPEELEGLRRSLPLAAVVLLLGPWSEGEMRSGEPLPGTVRVYWHQWLATFERQMQSFDEGICSVWTLPATATDEERLLWSERNGIGSSGNGWRAERAVAIVVERTDATEWLTDACTALGLAAVRPGASGGNPTRDVAAVLWDMSTGEEDMSQLAALIERYGQAPIIALVGFPRPADRERLLSAGAASVLSKPLALADLEWELNRAVHRHAPMSFAESINRSSAS
jgi:CheY-like chemotaxis protein